MNTNETNNKTNTDEFIDVTQPTKVNESKSKADEIRKEVDAKFQKKNEESKNSTTQKIIIMILIIIILCLLVFGGCFIFKLSNSGQPVSSASNKILAEVNKITEISAEDRQAAINQLVEDSEINITYASKAEFTGDTSTLFLVRNIENNHYPIVFEIFDEGGKSIYKSEPIDIGYEVSAISLEEPLAVGVHECTIRIGYDGQGNVNSTFPLTITVNEAE